MALNETHDASLKSWVTSANAADTDFPMQNLPFGVFRRKRTSESFRGGVAIGDQIVDLEAARQTLVFDGLAAELAEACENSTLNEFMSLGPRHWSALRLALSRALRQGSPHESRLRACLVPQAQAEYAVPAHIGDYTDFYSSLHHAMSVGSMFRPDNPLLPNYKWVPIAYHGRSSSIRVSGQQFPRPLGQTRAPTAPADAAPEFGPSKRIDYETELGVFVGPGNALGERVSIANAESHLFGLVILNDWSARDVQAWEYQPLGPFLAKNFASTISPWIVTLEALEPYRTEWTRAASDPQPLPYIDSPDNRARGAFDIQIEVALQTEKMRKDGQVPARVSRTSFKHGYWTLAQMLTHHTSNGCNLMPGDLIGTGTQSGPTPEEAGSMLELAKGGKSPLTLPSGETRSFIEDGDSVVMRAWCEKPGAARIGFGECVGTLLPAVQ